MEVGGMEEAMVVVETVEVVMEVAAMGGGDGYGTVVAMATMVV